MKKEENMVGFEKDGKKGLAVLICMLSLLFVPFVAGASPIAYINEVATIDFSGSGDVINVSGIGYVEVETPNPEDVLQFLRLNLTGISSTNLQSDQAYRHVAVSPMPGYRSRMYLRTNNSEEDLEYIINGSDNLRSIKLKLDYYNNDGGTALSSNKTSIYTFKVFIDSEIYISLANMTMRSRKDTYYLNDSMNITQVSSSEPGYTINIVDTDSDGWNDGIDLAGSVDANQTVIITFNSTLTPDLNYNKTELSVNLDQDFSIRVMSNYDGTFTGIGFSDKFSRGPIREGVTVIPFDPPEGPRIRGFIKNVALGLDYTVSGWDIYKVSDLNSPVLSDMNYTLLQPSDTLYTGWYEAPAGEKPYYTSSFDWRVYWDNESLYGTGMSRMRLPVLTGMKIFGDKSISLSDDCPNSQTIYVSDLMKHIGSEDSEIDIVQINSTIPHLTADNETYLWTANNVRVWYENATGSYEITSLVDYTIVNPTSSQDGYVRLNFSALDSLNYTIKMNEKIIMNYTLSSSPLSHHSQFKFDSTYTAITTTGSPYTTEATITALICKCSVYEEEPEPPGGGGGGGGGGGSSRRELFDIIKEHSDIWLVEDNIAEVEVIDGIVARGGKITNAGVFIYVPSNNDLDIDSINIMTYDSSSSKWNRLVNGVSFDIKSKGIESIGEMKFSSYLINKTGESWTFEDDDKIRIIYLVNVSVGTNYILTRVFGTTPKGKEIFEDAYTPIRYPVGLALPKVDDLIIKEGGWEQEERIDVGYPGTWIKTVEVYNPNKDERTGEFVFEVFPDMLNAYVLEDGEVKNFRIQKIGDQAAIIFNDVLASHERKVYFLKAVTPPVIEGKKELSVLESNETSALFEMSIILDNIALEDYENVFYEIPVAYENIVSLSYESEEIDKTDQLRIDSIEGKGKRRVIITYRERIPFIDLIIDPEYFCTSPVNYTVYVVPSETGREFYIETELLGPESYNNLAYADITGLGDVEIGKQIRVPKSIGVLHIPAGKYRLVTRLRKDFLVIQSKEREVEITCYPERKVFWLWWLFVLLLLLILYRSRCEIRKIPLKADTYYLGYLLKKIDKIIKGERYFAERNAILIGPARISLAVRLFNKAMMVYTDIMYEYQRWLLEEDRKCSSWEKRFKRCRLNEDEKRKYGDKIAKAYRGLVKIREDVGFLIEVIRGNKKSDADEKKFRMEKIRQKEEYVKQTRQEAIKEAEREGAEVAGVKAEENKTENPVEGAEKKEEKKEEENKVKKDKKGGEPSGRIPWWMKFREEKAGKTKKGEGKFYFVDKKGNVTTLKVTRRKGKETMARGTTKRKLRHVYNYLDEKGKVAEIESAKRLKVRVKRATGHIYIDEKGNVTKVMLGEGKEIKASAGIERIKGDLLYYVDDKGAITEVNAGKLVIRKRKEKSRRVVKRARHKKDLLERVCIERRPDHLYYIDEKGEIISVKAPRGGLRWAD